MTSVFDDIGRGDPVAPVHHPAGPGAPAPAGGAGGGIDLSVFVSLGARVGDLVDGMAADRQRRAGMQPPSDEPIFKSGTAPASGILTLDLGSVPLGRVWQVRRIIVGGVTVDTAADGVAYVFAQGAPPADLVLTDCVEIFNDLPQGNTYGTHQLWLQGGEHLWVVFTGATEGQQYGASARVEDWDDDTYRSSFTE